VTAARTTRRCTTVAGALAAVLLVPVTGATGAPARQAPGLQEALARVQAADGPVRVVVQTVDAQGRPDVGVTVAAPARAEQVLREAAARPGTAAVEIDQVVHASAGGTDPLRPQQWQLRGLQAPAVWAVPGADQVVVAVVDSGVDATHPDLAGSVLPGHDYVEPGGDGTDDGSGHGTHVAGIVAARQGDGVGVAGLRPGTLVLPVRVLDDAGDGFTSAVADGITQAVADGADVINLSLGSASRSTVVQNAVQHALDQGVPVVASSGNARLDGDPTIYPASQAGVVSVAATGRNGLVAPYSSTGANVAVAAPGSDILSTVPDGWALASGTSMAAPHVSAVVAAMIAVSPDLTPAQVRSTLMATATDLAPAGADRSSGAGLLQPVAALRALGAAPVAAPGVPGEWPGLPRDLDDDGRADLLGVAGDGSLLRYSADGTGGVGGRSVIGKGWQTVDLLTSVGDWDGDGAADVVARRRSDAALVLYRGDGAGGWLGSRVIGSRWSGIDILLSPSDWDGDGVVDLLARRSSDGALVLYPGTGTGTVLPARVVGSRWGGVSQLVVLGDWDGDGAADIAARDASGRLVMYPGDGVGGFGVAQVIGTGFGTVRTLVGLGDWTGDGRPDLLAVLPSGELRAYRGNGTGGFAGTRPVGTGWLSLVLAR
jgi:subtilisin family serine protease